MFRWTRAHSPHFFCCLLLFGPTYAVGADVAATEMPLGCSLQAESKMIRIVICGDLTLDNDLLIAAGRAACHGTLPCGAWIWTAIEAAPSVAPENHDGLTQEQIVSSKGVWVAEKEAFISIGQVE